LFVVGHVVIDITVICYCYRHGLGLHCFGFLLAAKHIINTIY
jgi:hypothetical protein